MKNINNETCKWMRIGNGDLVPFSGEIPDVTRGNVSIKYYLKKQLESLEGEFEGNDYVQSIDLSHMDVTKLKNLKNMGKDCASLKKVVFNDKVVLNADFTDMISTNVELEGVTDDQKEMIHPTPEVEMISSMPTFNTVIKSRCDENGKWQFKAQDPLGITVDCILSNWDKYDEFIAEKNPYDPQLPYFLNTQHCTELGVPAEDKFISKKNKGSKVTDPRLCLADNDVITIHIPEDVQVDYIVAHVSGHNGAMSELDYVYNAEDGIYLDSTLITPASEGTSDIKIWCRDKRTDYKFFNGTLENNKKVWASFDFYKINKDTARIVFPPVTKVNPPIPDEVYTVLEQDGESVSTGVSALSGICLSADKSCLYGVSDTYGLYKINFDGKSELLYDTQTNKGDKETEYDLEGLTIDENGDLFACVENDQRIVKFPKNAKFKECLIVSTVGTEDLDKTMTEFNNGFEGIAYNNGTFYLGNQFKPISVTPYTLTGGCGESVILKFNNELGGTTEVGDLQYDPITNTLWVIDSRSSNIYNYDLEGNVIASYKTNIGSKANTESFVIDFENNKLYVACDNEGGTLYTFNFKRKVVEEPTGEVTEAPSEEPTGEVTVESLRTFLQSGEGELKLTNDIEIDSSLIVEADNLVLDLNGHTITNVLRGEAAEIWMFKIEGKPIDGEDGRYEPKTFTVKDSVGTGKVDGGDQLCYVQCCLLSKNGATVNIEGGYWTTGADITGSDRNDCIFVDNANLNITGGKFESTYPWMRGDIPVHFCVNTKDANTANCNVVITGGEFVDMDPSNNLTDSTPITNWVPEGYVSTSRVEGEHTIYTVTKA